MKKVFLLSVLISIICISCQSYEERLDEMKRENIIDKVKIFYDNNA